jgi:hypothetical protein
MEPSTVAVILSAAGLAVTGLVVGIIKAMRRAETAESICSYDGEQAREQTGLLRDIRDGIVALKYEMTAQRDLASRTCSSVEALHRRMDAIIESRKP